MAIVIVIDFKAVFGIIVSFRALTVTFIATDGGTMTSKAFCTHLPPRYASEWSKTDHTSDFGWPLSSAVVLLTAVSLHSDRDGLRCERVRR